MQNSTESMTNCENEKNNNYVILSGIRGLCSLFTNFNNEFSKEYLNAIFPLRAFTSNQTQLFYKMLAQKRRSVILA